MMRRFSHSTSTYPTPLASRQLRAWQCMLPSAEGMSIIGDSSAIVEATESLDNLQGGFNPERKPLSGMGRLKPVLT